MSCDQFKNRFCSAPIISGSPHIVSSSERDTIASPFSKIDRYCPRNLRGEFCHIPNPNHGKVSELSKPRFPSQGGRGKTPACLLACLLGMLEPTSADEPVHHEGRPGPARPFSRMRRKVAFYRPPPREHLTRNPLRNNKVELIRRRPLGTQRICRTRERSEKSP